MYLKLKEIIPILSFSIISLYAGSQLIDNSSTFSNIDNKSYFRFHYDNDFFTKTDYYYTQGITLEYVHPSIHNFFLSNLLYRGKDSLSKTGITFNLFGYTPTSINSDAILSGDRPFEGSMTLKIFAISTNNEKKERIATALSIGVIGPVALGEEIQTNIHKWTGNKIPKGWKNQVKNDIILNYQVNIEKELLSSEAFILNGTAELRAGTLHDRLSGGFNFIAGHFNNPYNYEKKKKVQYYFYGQSRVNLVGYDATMQGGIFNRKSPYTIPSGNISRITFQADAGIVLNFRKLFLEYNQSFFSKEFSTGRNHRWGGVSLGFSF